MVRVKKFPVAPTTVSQKILQILRTKRSDSQTTDSSQSQIFCDLTLDSDSDNQPDSTTPRRVLQTARKSTGALMHHVKIKPAMISNVYDDEDDNEPLAALAEPRTVSYKSRNETIITARKSTGALMHHVKIKPAMSSVYDDEDDNELVALAEPRTVSYKSRDGTVKKRYAPGTKALKEIRILQKSTAKCIPKAPFARVIREITRSLTPSEIKFTVGALIALHVSF